DDAAVSQLCHRLPVDHLPWRARERYGWKRVLPATLQLLVLDQHVAAPLVEIDAKDVAGAQPGESATHGTLGRGVQDRGAVRRPRLATVADGRQASDALPQQMVGRLHVHDLRRTWPADGPCAAH